MQTNERTATAAGEVLETGPLRPDGRGPLAAVSRFFAWVAGGLILISALMVTVDVAARKLFSVSMLNSFELSTYAFAAAVSLGYAYALLAKSHIRIEVVYTLLSRRTQVILDILSMLLLAASATMLAYFALKTVQFSYRIDAHSNSTLAVPLVVPQGIWFSGLAIFAFASCWLTVKSVYRLFGGRIEDISRDIGIIALEEELSMQSDTLGPRAQDRMQDRTLGAGQ